MKKNILFVNDSLSMAGLSGKLAEEIRVTSVSTGRQGLEALQQHGPWCAVLSALKLPDMSGVSFLQQVASFSQAATLLLSPDNQLDVSLHQANLHSFFRVLATSSPKAALENALVDAVRHHEALQREESMRKQLRQFQFFDQLTGCLLRARLLEGVRQLLLNAIEQHQALAIILCDLDGLRRINENYGHEAGDLLLYTLVQRCQCSLVQDVDLIGRWGEDEFILALPGANLAEAGRRANALCADFASTPINWQSQRFSASASFAVSCYDPETPERNTRWQELIRTAERCLVHTKAAGGNQVLCCP